jgi:hypothetical protein
MFKLAMISHSAPSDSQVKSRAQLLHFAAIKLHASQREIVVKETKLRPPKLACGIWSSSRTARVTVFGRSPEPLTRREEAAVRAWANRPDNTAVQQSRLPQHTPTSAAEALNPTVSASFLRMKSNGTTFKCFTRAGPTSTDT